MSTKLSDIIPYILIDGLLDESPLYRIGCIISEYYLSSIEFKIRASLNYQDKIISSKCDITNNNEFYIIYNTKIHETDNNDKSNVYPLLFNYNDYDDSYFDTTQPSKLINFRTKFSIKNFMILYNKNHKKIKQSVSYHSPFSPFNSNKNKKYSYDIKRNNKGNGNHNRFSNYVSRYNRKKMNNIDLYLYNSTPMDTKYAVLYDQKNILWCFYNNKHTTLDNYAWLPIINLWKQNDKQKIFMLRGPKVSNDTVLNRSPNTLTTPNVSLTYIILYYILKRV